MVWDLNKCKGLLNPKIKFMDEYILNLKINMLPQFNRNKKVLLINRTMIDKCLTVTTLEM